MLTLSLLFFPFFLQAQQGDSQTQEKAEKIQLFGELSLEAKEIKMGAQRNPPPPQIQNFALGLESQLSPHLRGHFELLGQQNQNNTDVSLGEVHLIYRFPFYNPLQLKLGNTYYSYGLLTSQEGLLSQRPSYYVDLLVTRRGIDLGVELSWKPFENTPLWGSYSYFSGTTLRTGDLGTQEAKQAPQFFLLRFAPKYLEARLTYLIRHYGNQPRFQAQGLDLALTPLHFFEKTLKWSPQGEVWQLNYSRQDGLSRQGHTWLLGTYTEFFGFYHRWLYSRETWKDSSSFSQEVKAHFHLHGLGFRFNEYVQLEYQNIRNQEQQEALNLTTLNEQVYRVFLSL